MARVVQIVLCLAAWSMAFGSPASAMEFTVTLAPDGLRVVTARGQVVAGDAERLAAALRTTDRDAFGNKHLFLNSKGGLVGEALDMVKVMDHEKVTTIIGPGAECASACAQILYLSGVHRYVLDGGRLGLHSCWEAGKGTASTSCNDLIAKNALAHGTGYASIMAFMQFTEPSRMRWFDAEEADCWGFTRWPPGTDRGSKDGEAPLCILKPPTSTGKLPTK